MEEKTMRRRTAQGIVRNVFDDAVEILLQYNADGESVLCRIPARLWEKRRIEPVPDQHVEISWNPHDHTSDPDIREIPYIPGHTPASPEFNALRDAFGLNPSSKVLIVIGPNPPREYQGMQEAFKQSPNGSESYKKLLSQLNLKTAGWGECLSLTYLIPFLNYFGVTADNIVFNLCETTYRTFRPSRYADHSIFFLGSTKSNSVLEQKYWDAFGLKNTYEFKDYELLIKRRDGAPLQYQCDDQTHTVPRDQPERMNVEDYFLLAKLPNPYSQEAVKPNCFIAAGIGTVGTGYASVTLASKRSASFFCERFQRDPFAIVGKVDMKGMFNPSSDPVSFVFDGNRDKIMDPPPVLLHNALSSPKIWSVYSEDNFRKDLERFRQA